MVSDLKDVLKRLENWPEPAQRELAEIAREIESTFSGGIYHATPEELRAIDEAEQSGVASEADVESAFRAFRRA